MPIVKEKKKQKDWKKENKVVIIAGNVVVYIKNFQVFRNKSLSR